MIIGVAKSKLPVWIQACYLLFFFVAFTRDFQLKYSEIWYLTYALSIFGGVISFFKNRNLKPRAYLVWIFVMWLWVGLSLLWSPSNLAYNNFIRAYTTGAILYFSLFYIIKDFEDVKQMMRLMVMAMVLSIMYTLLTVDLVSIMLGTRLGSDGSEDVTVSSNDMGMMCFYGILMCCYFIKEKTNSKFRTIYFCLCLLILLGMTFISGSRRALLGIAIVFFIYMLLSSKNKLKNIIKISVVVLASLILFRYLMSFDIFSSILGYRLEGMFNSISGSGAGDNSYDHHEEMIIYGWRYFFNNPIIGNGHLAFAELYGRDTGDYIFSHNNITELLVNYGIVGFIIYYWFIIYLVNKLIKIRRITDDRSIIFFLAIILSQFVTDWTNVAYILFVEQMVILFAYNIVRNADNYKKI